MRVADLCSPDVVTIEPRATLRAASLAMRNAHVGALVVVEDKGGVRRPVGMLTDRDIVVSVIAVPGARPEGIRVCDAMSSRVALAHADEGLLSALNTMRKEGVRRLPVIGADGALQGILTLDDVLDAMADVLSNLAEAARWGRKRELAARKRIEIGGER
jgi:CBS domain-containing protein